jgi:hypothetical protein
VNDKMEGEGTFVWSDGRTFKGQWKDNLIHGKGVYKWPDGRIYDG